MSYKCRSCGAVGTLDRETDKVKWAKYSGDTECLHNEVSFECPSKVKAEQLAPHVCLGCGLIVIPWLAHPSIGVNTEGRLYYLDDDYESQVQALCTLMKRLSKYLKLEHGIFLNM